MGLIFDNELNGWSTHSSPVVDVQPEPKSDTYLIVYHDGYEGHSTEYNTLSEAVQSLGFLAEYELDDYALYRVRETLNVAKAVEAYEDTRKNAIAAAKAKLTREELELLGIA